MDARALSEEVAAFGGDKDQAEAEVEERWQALKRVDPGATRDRAMGQLAWEFASRTIEHVFPGDNWYFMVKAAQSAPPIPSPCRPARRSSSSSSLSGWEPVFRSSRNADSPNDR